VRAESGEGIAVMKSISKRLIPVAVAAVAVLLLAGFQTGNKKEIPKTSTQKEAVIDTTEVDTMEAFYERMRRWKALHGYTDRWESDK
jgi:hypothetical protein